MGTATDGRVLLAASGLQLFITRDGTAELGSRQRQQLARRDYQRVVLHPHDNRWVAPSRPRALPRPHPHTPSRGRS